jgi:hypothetical protein
MIPGATITVRRIATNQTFSALTTSKGEYAVFFLPVGEYTIAAGARGFEGRAKSGVVLQADQTVRVDFVLSAGSAKKTVAEATQTSLLNSQKATVGQIIGNQQLEALPLNARDYVSLTYLTTSVVPVSGNLAIGRVRGMRQDENVAYIGGALMTDGNGSLPFIPNLDALQEFEVKTGLYDSEYGIQPGEQLVVVTKSGTNLVHGDAFDFVRNDVLDARNFFEPIRQPFKRNQYGGTIGGPIYIPKLTDGRNREWFFFAFQDISTRQIAPLTGVVPTDAEREGLFSTSIEDPETGQNFPNNIIPTNRMSPIAQKLLPFWPEPNTPGQLNFTSPNTNLNEDSPQVMSRIEVDRSSHSRWWGQMIWDSSPYVVANAIQTFTAKQPLHTWIASIGNTTTLGSRSVNEAGLHFFRRPYTELSNNPDCDFPETLGIPALLLDPVNRCGVPDVNLQDLLSIGNYNTDGPVMVGSWLARDEFASHKGSHFLQTGLDFRRHYNLFVLDARDSFTFLSRYTGNSIGDFLLGLPSNTSSSGESQRGNFSQDSFYSYLQDMWKASQNLTVNFGLRYELRLPWKDKRGFMANWDPATGWLFPALQSLTLQPWQTGRFQANSPLVSWSPASGLLPRLDLTYRLREKTVIRSGYALYGGEPDVGAVQGFGSNPRPGAEVLQFISALSTPQISLSDPFPASLAQGAVPTLTGIQSPLKLSRTHTWGLSIQHSFSPNWLVDVGYEGSHTSDQLDAVSLNDATPGFGSRQARRPYPDLQTVIFYEPDGNAWYDGLNLKVQKRAAREGLFLLASFTWSKALDTTNSSIGDVEVDPLDRVRSRNMPPNLEKALTTGLAGRRLVLTVDYQLPFGTGKPFARRGIPSRVVGGWSFQGIATLQDGPWFTIFLPGDALDTGSQFSQFPNRVCNPNLATAARTPNYWFNTACFAVPTGLTYGNAGRSTVLGPGILNMDLALHKDFHLHEGQAVQFRAEAFNFANHPNFQTPGNNFGTPSFGIVGEATDPRQIQFALKYMF